MFFEGNINIDSLNNGIHAVWWFSWGLTTDRLTREICSLDSVVYSSTYKHSNKYRFFKNKSRKKICHVIYKFVLCANSVKDICFNFSCFILRLTDRHSNILSIFDQMGMWTGIPHHWVPGFLLQLSFFSFFFSYFLYSIFVQIHADVEK